jgi:hypothetical protein
LKRSIFRKQFQQKSHSANIFAKFFDENILKLTTNGPSLVLFEEKHDLYSIKNALAYCIARDVVVNAGIVGLASSQVTFRQHQHQRRRQQQQRHESHHEIELFRLSANQGCQIFSLYNIPKLGKIHQIALKCSKRQQNRPNC